MKRQILFRGKRVDNGEWVEGYYFKTIPETTQHYIIGNKSPYNSEVVCNGDFTLSMYDYNEIIPETVGQFTGLTDKNGVKIFEEDIVKDYYSMYEDDLSIVMFSNGAFYPTAQVKEGYNCISKYDNLQFEVIGNIHDNPELLK